MTPEDVSRLAREPSPNVREGLAAKIAQGYHAGHFSGKELRIAEEIFRLLLRDAEKRVRKALAENLRYNHHVAHDIIWQLANDTPDVAVAVLEFSSVLTEDDLIAIVRSTREMAKLTAIARRESISEALADTLLETRSGVTARTLINNRGAMVSESSLLKAWEFIAADESLLEALVHRGGLPMAVAEKLFAAVSEPLQRHLVKQYRLPHVIAQDAVDDAREWAMLGVMSAQYEEREFSDEDMEKLVDELYLSGRLTHSLIIRALCTGDLSFFEIAMARLAKVPRINARILMMDTGPLGFGSFYQATHMPEGFFEAVKVLLRIAMEETSYGRFRREDFRKRMLERIKTGGYDRTVENMQYLLMIIGGKFDAPPTLQ